MEVSGGKPCHRSRCHATGCAIQSAVPAKGHAAVRTAAVSLARKQVKGSEDPAGAGALQPEDPAAPIWITVAALDSAFRRGPIKVPCRIQGKTGVGTAPSNPSVKL